jgi:hypothetical protein
MRFVRFTDNLADLTVDRAGAAARAAGFDGLDLTLRPGGHVPPERAEVGLSEAKRRADAAGVTIPMVSTAVTDVDSPHAEAVFAATAHYGARLVRLGYWEYRPFGALAAQVDEARAKLGETENAPPSRGNRPPSPGDVPCHGLDFPASRSSRLSQPRPPWPRIRSRQRPMNRRGGRGSSS